jgi:hypothetical protein
MSESAIRTQVAAIVNGVTNIGKVYDYERWAADWSTFISLFKTTISGTAQIRGWEIGRRGFSEKQVAIGTPYGQNEKRHIFFIRGYLGLDDSAATEKIFNGLIEAISDAFRNNWTLNDTALNHEWIQADIIEMRMFGSVLCHYCELSLAVCEEI